MHPDLIPHARPNVLEIDLDAVSNCVRELRDVVGRNVRIYAALKSNAYGYGLLEIAKTVLASGADALSCVDRADAIRLRQAGFTVPILVYAGSIIDQAAVAACEQYDLVPTLLDRSEIAICARHATRAFRFAVKLNVGQERLGVDAEEIVPFVQAALATAKLELEVINAHPTVPAAVDPAVHEWQYKRFVTACAALESAGIKVPVKLFAASKTLAVTLGMNLDAIDPGQALYGPIKREPGKPAPAHQRPLQALKSKLIQVRPVVRSEFRDRAPFPIRDGMVLGVIPIGASDGMLRLNMGEVLVRGRRAKILATPSLEYTRIDLTGIEGAALGDEVVIIGGQGDDRIYPEDVAAHHKVQVTDVVMSVRETIPRQYLTRSSAPSPS